MIAEFDAALLILMNDDLYLDLKDLKPKEKESVKFSEEKAVSVYVEEELKPEFNFIGKNQKNFLILINEALPENHLKALESTLLRKKLSLADIAILDYPAANHKNFADINTSFMPQKMVCFGVKPKDLNLPNANFNKISNYENLQILYTYSFTEMLGNKEKTKSFWEQMKTL